MRIVVVDTQERWDATMREWYALPWYHRLALWLFGQKPQPIFERDFRALLIRLHLEGY